MRFKWSWVSVPIRGLFNLTVNKMDTKDIMDLYGFRPHQGII